MARLWALARGRMGPEAVQMPSVRCNRCWARGRPNVGAVLCLACLGCGAAMSRAALRLVGSVGIAAAAWPPGGVAELSRRRRRLARLPCCGGPVGRPRTWVRGRGGLRVWRELYVLRRDGLGSSFCARRGRCAKPVVTLERYPCEAIGRWPSWVESAATAGCFTRAWLAPPLRPGPVGGGGRGRRWGRRARFPDARDELRAKGKMCLTRMAELRSLGASLGGAASALKGPAPQTFCSARAFALRAPVVVAAEAQPNGWVLNTTNSAADAFVPRPAQRAAQCARVRMSGVRTRCCAGDGGEGEKTYWLPSRSSVWRPCVS